MKTSLARLAAVVLLCAASLAFMSCYYVPGGLGGGLARATINVPLPPNVTSIALIVGGPGMNTITNQYPVGTTTATLTVPSGIARTFTLLENTPSVTLIGNATVDLAPGETKSIALTPTAGASQIIVPDYYNYRLVQISDMSGTGWTTLSSATPYDIDFDDQGRIYVANSSSIVQIMDISGANPVTVASAAGTYKSIALDRAHGMLYYAGTDAAGAPTLFRKQVTPTLGTIEESVALTSIVANPTVTGVAVDSDGFVYIANTTPATILKIDPSTFTSPKIVASYSGTLSYPWDILVNGDYIYVSDNGALKIVRLSKNLQFVDSFSGPASDPFLGPERFVAILNKPITLIDESSSGSPDRLVSFNDMSGAGWTTIGSTGTGTDNFKFYIGS
ncbi:MAG: hypothetical protein ABSB63_23160 [Spirochaetia bacterium]